MKERGSKIWGDNRYSCGCSERETRRWTYYPAFFTFLFPPPLHHNAGISSFLAPSCLVLQTPISIQENNRYLLPERFLPKHSAHPKSSPAKSTCRAARAITEVDSPSKPLGTSVPPFLFEHGADERIAALISRLAPRRNPCRAMSLSSRGAA